MRIGEARGGNVLEIIRAAEKFIASGEYNVALDQLINARNMQPNNAYIDAIIERIHSLQNEKEQHARSAAQREQKPLSVTVGHEFPGGVKEKRDEEYLSRQDVEAQVRRLTMMAQTLLERGSCESAFDALMKAYLLDPLSPDVLACEKTLLPAWELLNRKKAESARATGQPRQQFEFPSGGEGDPRKSESARLEILKQQKEMERLERERAMWREASMPPKILQQNGSGSPSGQDPSLDQKKSGSGLLTKFRFGRLLS